MPRRFVPFALLAAVLIGCAKKKDDPAGGGKDGGGGDSSATYTIKIRDEQVGERYQVAHTTNSVTTFSAAPKGQPKKTEEKRESSRYEYTEELIELKDPAERPTKVRHVYTTAERTVNGKTVPASFQNKAVSIERVGKAYRFRIEKGPAIAGEEAKHFEKQYNTKPRRRQQELLPDRPVRLNEVWEVNKAVLAREFKDDGLIADDAKTVATGKLTEVYRKDGKQYGVIELHIEVYPLAVNESGRQTKLKAGSKFVYDIRGEGCIDGSVVDMALVNRSVGEFTILGPTEVRVTAEGTNTVSGVQLK